MIQFVRSFLPAITCWCLLGNANFNKVLQDEFLAFRLPFSCFRQPFRLVLMLNCFMILQIWRANLILKKKKSSSCQKSTKSDIDSYLNVFVEMHGHLVFRLLFLTSFFWHDSFFWLFFWHDERQVKLKSVKSLVVCVL